MTALTDINWGTVLNAAGLFVGIVGVAIAIRSHLKLKTAENAVKLNQDKLFNHMASEEFREIGRMAVELIQFAMKKIWIALTDVSIKLAPKLSEAKGAWGSELKQEEQDQLDASVSRVQELIQVLPVLEQLGPASEVELGTIVAAGRFIMDVANQVAGRLKHRHLQEAEAKT